MLKIFRFLDMILFLIEKLLFFFQYQDDMEKIVAKFKDSLELKKRERQAVQSRLQQTKVGSACVHILFPNG